MERGEKKEEKEGKLVVFAFISKNEKGGAERNPPEREGKEGSLIHRAGEEGGKESIQFNYFTTDKK